MFCIIGEIYNIQIQHTLISITTEISGLKNVFIEANENEDFSIFDLGPAIADNITMSCERAQIGEFYYPNACITIKQRAGKDIEVLIRLPRTRKTDPIDSGRQIHYIKDYVVKYQ